MGTPINVPPGFYYFKITYSFQDYIQLFQDQLRHQLQYKLQVNDFYYYSCMN